MTRGFACELVCICKQMRRLLSTLQIALKPDQKPHSKNECTVLHVEH